MKCFATGTTNLSIDTWYHVACTYDGRGGSTAYNGMTLYINRVAESVTTIGGSLNIGKLYYGGNKSLQNITAFSKLVSIGGTLSVFGNESLTNLNGLESVSTLGSGVTIRYNEVLNNKPHLKIPRLPNSDIRALLIKYIHTIN